jgi:hypothetical protein
MSLKEFKVMIENQQKEIDERNEMISILQQNFENLKLQHIREKNEGMEKGKNLQSIKELNLQLNTKIKAQTQKLKI